MIMYILVFASWSNSEIVIFSFMQSDLLFILID